MRIATLVLSATAVAAVALGATYAAGKDDIKPSVTYAKSWEKAIEEAKLLNVPMVVHSHGFY